MRARALILEYALLLCLVLLAVRVYVLAGR